MQILVRCEQPHVLASHVFAQDHVVEAKLQDDGKGVLVRTRDVSRFYAQLNQLVVEGLLQVDAVAPADDDVNSVYQYLIGSEGAVPFGSKRTRCLSSLVVIERLAR